MQPDIQDQAVIDADELMAKTAGFKLSAEREAMVDDLQSRYPNKKATLLPLLWAIQEQEGWISVLTGQASMSFGPMNLIVMFGKLMKRTTRIRYWTGAASQIFPRMTFPMWTV